MSPMPRIRKPRAGLPAALTLSTLLMSSLFAQAASDEPRGGDGPGTESHEAPIPAAVGSAPPAAEAAAETAPTAEPAATGAPDHAVAAAGAGPVEEQELPVGSVMLDGVEVLKLLSARGSRSAKERAREASSALARAIKANNLDVRYKVEADGAAIFVGDVPVLQLFAEDAKAAGDSSLEVHAAQVAERLGDALANERRRKSIANTVLSLALAVLLALVGLFMMRRIGLLTERFQAWVDGHKEGSLALRAAGFEVLSSAASRVALFWGIAVLKWGSWLGLLYAYLVLVSSMFTATQGLAEKLTELALSPLRAALARFGALLPELFALVVVGVLVVFLIRLSQSFFSSVKQGDTQLAWLPRELAAPADALTRTLIVLLALVVAAPLFAGDHDGAIFRIGTYCLIAVALACVPLLASAALGVVLVLSRYLRLGDSVRLGKVSGRVEAFGMLHIELSGAQGAVTKVPYLGVLLCPLKVGGDSELSCSLEVDPTAPPRRVIEQLLLSANKLGADARVELVRLDGKGARYMIHLKRVTPAARSEFLILASEALAEAGIKLGAK
jgi:hypothetical protein